MRTIAEKNFEMMMKYALSGEEMINVRGGDEGGGGEDGDPEKPPIGTIKV